MNNFAEILNQINDQITFKQKEYLLSTGKPFLNYEGFLACLNQSDFEQKHAKNSKILSLDIPLLVNIEMYLNAGEENTKCVWFNSVGGDFGCARHGELVALDSRLSSSHRHDYLEVTFVFQGECSVVIQGDKHVFKEHELYFVDRNCVHQDLRDENRGIFIYICIRPEMFNDFFLKSMTKNKLYTLLRGDLSKKQQTSYISVGLSDQTAKLVENYISLLYQEMCQRQTGYIQMMQVYLLRLFDAVGAGNRVELSNFDQHSRNYLLFREITKYMEENLTDHDLEDLALEFHFQKDYYNRIIKNYTGLTFSEYSRKLRLEKAKRLLVDTRLTMKEIAELLGYSEESYLFRIFKKEFGVTPNDFRANNRTMIKT